MALYLNLGLNHLCHYIWWPLTWKQWLWIETPDVFVQIGCKSPCKKIRILMDCNNCILSIMSWESIHSPPTDSHTAVGTLPTRKKVLTSLLEPPKWQLEGWSWTATAPHCQTRPLGSYHFLLSPPRDTRKCDCSWGCWMDWWACPSHDLSLTCQFAPEDCAPCHSNTRFEWIHRGELPG